MRQILLHLKVSRVPHSASYTWQENKVNCYIKSVHMYKVKSTTDCRRRHFIHDCRRQCKIVARHEVVHVRIDIYVVHNVQSEATEGEEKGRLGGV